MATKTLDDRLAYVPGTTLGRSGYVFSASDRLGMRIAQLDALLCVISVSPESDDDEGFQNCNPQIQFSVLELAGSLATEIHELHEELLLADLRAEHRRASPESEVRHV